MKITHLGNHPELCDEIAKRTYNEWSDYYDKLSNIKSAEDWAERLRTQYTNVNFYPSGFVVIDPSNNNKFIAFASLEVNDAFKENGRRKTWLSNVYVLPEYRGKGIAQTFIENLSTLAKDKYKIPSIFLWLEDSKLEKFYESVGFTPASVKTIEGYSFTVYKKELIPDESLIQPVHIIGLFVILVIIFFIRKIFGFIFYMLGIFQPKKVVIEIK